MKHTFSENGFVTFAEGYGPNDPLSKLEKKLPQVEKRIPRELAASEKIDAAIQDALLTWRQQAKNMHSLLKIPATMEFTTEELDLAGWIHEYAAQAGLDFKLAMRQVFDYLKRHPKALANYTNGEASFAEFADSGVSLAVPAGYEVNPQRMELFRRARVYQAGHPGCEFTNAVRMADLP
ncbi:hypothetical protein GALL_26170 [mine drainage metagenome]|uniref:Uncharacterized protein n=1 Tax=mine drainage metagenome TaxID=410659 RepID=A0A1J5TKG5_9ZZZZ